MRATRHSSKTPPGGRRHSLIAATVAAGLLCAGLLCAPAVGAPATALVERSQPLILASDPAGNIWWGGAAANVASPEPEAEANVWRFSREGVLTNIRLPTSPAFFPEYFAAGRDGREWFLAEGEEGAPDLGSVSTAGQLTLKRIAFPERGRLRGLAIDSRGSAWTTQSGRRHGRSLAAIVRIAPDGRVTVFERGLLPGASPANIVAASDGTLWFLDDAGRVGRVWPNGRVREMPIGRPIVEETERAFAPARPLLVNRGSVWFIAGPETIGRLDPHGGVSFITPRSSYRGVESLGGRDGALMGLAADGRDAVWFTRDSGEVARIEPDGGIRTVTNRLVDAYGIAFDRRGRAWVGEGPGYQHETQRPESGFRRELELRLARPSVEPARIAEIDPGGRVRQYPPPPPCRVPSMIGVERSLVPLINTRPYSEQDSEAPLSRCEHRIRLAKVVIRREGRRGRLFVVAQDPAPGTPTYGYEAVALTLAVPRRARTCVVPAPFSALLRSKTLLVWRVATAVSREPGLIEGLTETYYGCVRGVGPRRVVATSRVDDVQGGDAITKIVGAGHFVALVDGFGDKYGSTETLTVEDVGTGRTRTTTVEDDASEYGGQPGSEPLPALEALGTPVGRGVYALALSATGVVAWVGRTEGDPTQDVLYLQRRGRVRRLAAAASIGDLVFAGSALTWNEAGTARSAHVG